MSGESAKHLDGKFTQNLLVRKIVSHIFRYDIYVSSLFSSWPMKSEHGEKGYKRVVFGKYCTDQVVSELS